jgi:hypothetical protein
MKNELENNLLIFYFLKFIKIIRNKSYKLKSWMKIKLKYIYIISQMISNKINNNQNNRNQI